MPKLRWKQIISPRARAISRADAARDIWDPNNAARLYQEVIRLWGPTYGLLMQLGNALKDSGAFELAERAYMDALAIRDGEADTFLQYGHLMKLSGNPEKAAKLYRKALRIEPHMIAARQEIDKIVQEQTRTTDNEASSGRSPAQSYSAIGSKTCYVSLRTDMPLPASAAYYRLVNQHRWRRG